MTFVFSVLFCCVSVLDQSLFSNQYMLWFAFIKLRDFQIIVWVLAPDNTKHFILKALFSVCVNYSCFNRLCCQFPLLFNLSNINSVAQVPGDSCRLHCWFIFVLARWLQVPMTAQESFGLSCLSFPSAQGKCQSSWTTFVSKISHLSPLMLEHHNQSC